MSTFADRAEPDRAEHSTQDISPAPEAARSPRRGRWAWAGLLICLALIAAWSVVAWEHPAVSSSAASTAAPVIPPVPVSVAEVARRDYPIYVRGIGSVQA